MVVRIVLIIGGRDWGLRREWQRLLRVCGQENGNYEILWEFVSSFQQVARFLSSAG